MTKGALFVAAAAGAGLAALCVRRTIRFLWKKTPLASEHVRPSPPETASETKPRDCPFLRSAELLSHMVELCGRLEASNEKILLLLRSLDKNYSPYTKGEPAGSSEGEAQDSLETLELDGEEVVQSGGAAPTQMEVGGGRSRGSERVVDNKTLEKAKKFNAAGNEAFEARRYTEAVEYYTSALENITGSRVLAAICFCNRAAAYHSLGRITDSIADCNFAIHLDPSYLKVLSTRSTLYEMIRDYGQAAKDINRLICILGKQIHEKGYLPGHCRGSSKIYNDLKRARARLSKLENEARKNAPLHMYKILGLEPTCAAADVKASYRKAALRNHPDKACYFLRRSDYVNDKLAEEMHADAGNLFKSIGEAYSVLSDPTKRLQYDKGEELRDMMKSYD